VGDTMNDGVFSLWNGQDALKYEPAFLSGTYLPTSSTIFIRLSTSWEMVIAGDYREKTLKNKRYERSQRRSL
jgi:hypothetical protein